MPPTKAAVVGQALDKVYLSIFLNTTVQSFRTEPYAIALRPQGTHLAPDGVAMEGNSQTTLAQQRMVSMAFNTRERWRRSMRRRAGRWSIRHYRPKRDGSRTATRSSVTHWD
jgi:hypothetical protein